MQDSHDNRVWQREVGCQKQMATSLANNPIRPGLNLASTRQMAPPKHTSDYSVATGVLIYLPRKDERLSWSSWLTFSARFTHISGHRPAVGQAQDSESSLVKYRRSTAVLRQPTSVVPVSVRFVWSASVDRMSNDELFHLLRASVDSPRPPARSSPLPTMIIRCPQHRPRDGAVEARGIPG